MVCSEAGVETASQWVPAFEYQSLGISKITGDLSIILKIRKYYVMIAR